MQIQEKLLTPNPYSRPKTPLKKVTKIIVHYVGNANSTGIANRNYFESLKVGKKGINGDFIHASSHYIIGLEGEIIQCVPENEIAYTSNSANSYSIGIECCHPKSDGKFMQKTYNSLIELLEYLCNKYNLDPLTDILRHYDITKKMCPLWYVNNPKEWQKLKEDVARQEVKELTEQQVRDIIKEEIDKINQATANAPVSEWAKAEWDKATDEKIVDGKRPQAPLTREQLTVILSRLGLL